MIDIHMKQRHEFEIFSLMDKCLNELRRHDYSKAIILGGHVDDLKEKLYGKQIG